MHPFFLYHNIVLLCPSHSLKVLLYLVSTAIGSLVRDSVPIVAGEKNMERGSTSHSIKVPFHIRWRCFIESVASASARTSL